MDEESNIQGDLHSQYFHNINQHKHHDDEEQITEQARRQLEVKNQLENELQAFSDGEDDISHAETFYNHDQSDALAMNPNINNDMANIYELRVQEIKKLSEDLKMSQQEARATEDSLFKQLAMSESHRERIEMSLRQCQELLSSSNNRMAALEKEVMSSNNKITELTMQNDELNAELKSTTTSLVNAQHTIQTLKCNKENTQTADSLIKLQQTRFEETITKLENDLMRVQHQLTEKEKKCLYLEKRCDDLESSKNKILIEKGSMINKLAMDLDESQKRFAGRETYELREKISRLMNEKETSQLQLKDLGSKFESTAADLVEYKTKYIQLQEDMLNFQLLLDKFVSVNKTVSFDELQSYKLNFGLTSHSETLNLLQNELLHTIHTRTLNNDQIKKLNEIIAQKDKTIQIMNESEKEMKKEMGKLKEESIKQTNDLKIMESKLSDLENKHSSISAENSRRKSIEKCSTDELIKVNDKLSYELKDAQKQIQEYKNMYIEARSIKDKLVNEINELKLQKSNHISKHGSDSFKESDTIEEHKMKLILKECAELQTSNTRLKSQHDDLQVKLSALTNELEESRKLIVRLNSEIELLECRNTLIEDLIEKAKHIVENNEKKMLNRKCMSTSTTEFQNKDEDQKISKKDSLNDNRILISNEKNIENLYNTKINELIEDFNQKLSEKETKYRKSLLQLSDLIKVKTKEVSTLQDVIFAERKKIQVLEAEKYKIPENVHEQCKKELNECQVYIKKLNKDSEKNVKTDALQIKLADTEKELDKLKEKYKTIKKTATKYKEYVTEKDKHVESEMKRIKHNYEESMKRMQEKLDICIRRKEQQVNLKISEIEAQYAEKLKLIKNESKAIVS